MNDYSENARTEYVSLREEINRSDKTCTLVMGFLFSVTGALATVYLSESVDQRYPQIFLLIVSMVWFFGFWYFTEKRFVIVRIAAYIRNHIENIEDGLGWQQYSYLCSKQKRYRRVISFDPYHLELAVCTIFIIGLSALQLLIIENGYLIWFLAASWIISLIYLSFLTQALNIYGNPQEFEL